MHRSCAPCREPGRAIVLCVGGAREALLAQPDHFELVLGKRLVGLIARVLYSSAALLLAMHVISCCWAHALSCVCQSSAACRVL
jgi:hypothetical protein